MKYLSPMFVLVGIPVFALTVVAVLLGYALVLTGIVKPSAA